MIAMKDNREDLVKIAVFLCTGLLPKKAASWRKRTFGSYCQDMVNNCSSNNVG